MSHSTLEDQLFSEILISQQTINAVRGPRAGEENKVKDQLDQFAKLRGKPALFNYFTSGRGHGPYTELIDGSVKMDLINGIGPNLLGHSHPIYIRSCLEAASVDSLMCGNLQLYSQTEKLTRTLLNYAAKGSKLKHFWYSCSGSFANDVALKLIWQKKAPRYGVLAFSKAFAGRSIATQDITYNHEYREGMPKLLQVKHIPHYDAANPSGSLNKTLEALDAAWDENPDLYGTLMMEIVQGEGGFIFGPRDFYVGIFEWAKKKNLAIWIDEVQTFARTYDLFAFQSFCLGEYVDVATVGKVLQACGTLFSEEYNPKPGLIAGTFNGSIASIIAGEKIVKFLTEGNFYGPSGRMKDLEQQFFACFSRIQKKPWGKHLVSFGGIGLMISFIVGDGSKDTTNTFMKKLFDNGLMSFTAGKDPMKIRFLPPISLTADHFKEIEHIIDQTLQDVFKS